MTNEYGEYLNYRIKTASSSKEKKYYENLAEMSDTNDGQVQYAEANTTSNAYVPKTQTGQMSSPLGSYINKNNTDKYKDIVPTTVDNDKDLQDALSGDTSDSSQDSRDLNLNGTSWGGMQSGAIKYDSTQSPNWLSTVPQQYQEKAVAWSNNQGILEIIPKQQRQKFTYSTIAYIAKHTNEPKTQRIPISDVSVVPHQINFDFYDTTEGRIGVSHASEKHMSVEFDVYLTDYIFYNWNFGGDNENKYYMDMPDKLKKIFWESILDKTYTRESLLADFEQTKEFTDFRSSFLQQHLGWMCIFNTHAFPTFAGVINDVSFSINSGESFAKWHVKLEEALFTEAYSETGQKPQEETTSEDGSTANSGGAENTENIQTG